MTIKPYAIIEIFRSRGFDSKEAEEIVDFVTESSQDKVLEVIKHLAAKEDVKELGLQIATLELQMATKEDVKELELQIAALELQMATKEDVKGMELQIKDIELRLVKWLVGTGIASIGILIATMKYLLK